MKQKLLKTMLLLCALVVGGASSVWATEYSYTFTAKVYESAGSQSLGSVSWTMAGTGGTYFGYDATKGQQFGSGSKPYSAVSLTTSGISGTITSIVVNASGAKDVVATISCTVGGSDFGTQNQSLTATATDYTFTGSASGDIVISFANTSSKALYVKSISVTYSTGGGGGSSASIVPDETNINAPCTAVDDGAIDVTYTGVDPTDGVEIVYYTTSSADVETERPDWILVDFDASYNLEYDIDANDGSARTAYLKIYGLDGEANDVFSDLITITQASGIDAPSFSTASGKIDAGTLITLTQAAADEIRYTTDGSEPTKTTGTVYSAPIAITTATTLKAIAVKDGGVSAVASAEYTINVAAPEYNFASSGNYLAGTGLTLTSAGNTIYYNMTTDGSTPEDPTSSSTEYTGPISLSSGKVIIKAIAYDAYSNPSSVTTRTVNGIAPATLPFNWAGGGKSALTALTGVVGYGLGTDYGDSHSPYMVKFDNNDDYIEIFTNAQPLKVTVGVKMIGGAKTSKIKVQESTNGVDFSDVQELTISGSQNDILSLVTTENFASTTRVIKLLFDKGDNIGVGPISITKYTVDPDIDASSSIDLAYNATSGEIEYSIINPDGISSLTAACSDDWISGITVGATKVTFTTTANTGAERTGTITLSYTGADDKVVTVTQAECPVELTYSPTTTITSGKHYIITNGTSGTVKAMGGQASNNRSSVEVTFDGDDITFLSNAGVTELVIQGPYANGYYTIYDASANGYLYAASSSNNYLRTKAAIEDDNSYWSIEIAGNGVATIKAKGNYTHNWLRNNGSLFSCYESGMNNVYLYEKAGEATPSESVTVTSVGYATYASDNALDFTGKSIEAYIATTKGDGTGVTFTRKYKIPARTGVLLHADGGATVDIPALAGGTAADAVTGNVFVKGAGAAVATDGDTSWNYILNNGASGLGFYKAAGQTVAKNRAYISILKSESASVKGFIALPGSEETAVEAVKAEAENGVIFNLAGQRIQKLQRGINIVNGRKVVVK